MKDIQKHQGDGSDGKNNFVPLNQGMGIKIPGFIEGQDTKDEMLKLLSDLLQKYSPPDDIREKTRLNQKEILFYTQTILYKMALYIYFDYECPYIDKMREEIFHLKISGKDGKGRDEFFNTLTALSHTPAKKTDDGLGFWQKAMNTHVR